MAANTRTVSGLRSERAVRRAISWILLAAFTLQSFITQTHIHGVPQAGGRAAIVKVFESTPAHKAPGENTTADCPLCQAIVHSGAFFAPVAPTLVLPATWATHATPLLVIAATGIAVTHIWQSRAPPHR
jgi:hypothetical protein